MSYHDEGVKFLVSGAECKWVHVRGNRWELVDARSEDMLGMVAPIDTDDWSSMYIWEYWCPEEDRCRRSFCGTIWEGKALVEARLLKERSNAHL